MVIKLKEIDGELLKNEILTINAMGLTNGQRKLNDGITFFGNKLKSVKNISYFF